MLLERESFSWLMKEGWAQNIHIGERPALMSPQFLSHEMKVNGGDHDTGVIFSIPDPSS